MHGLQTNSLPGQPLRVHPTTRPYLRHSSRQRRTSPELLAMRRAMNSTELGWKASMPSVEAKQKGQRGRWEAKLRCRCAEPG